MTREVKYVYSAEDRTGAAVASVKRGMQSVSEVAAVAGFNLAAIGGSITLAGLASLVKRINDNVDALNDIQDATGSSIENISALEDVAMRGGHAFDVVGSSLIKFNQTLGSTIKPGTDAEAVLKRIGLNAKQLRELDPSEALRQTAVALSQFADDGAKARAAQDLFGKSLKEVQPFLNDLAQAGELQAKVTAQQAEEAEKFNKQLFGLQATLKEVGRTIANPVVTHMTELINKLKDVHERGDLAWEVLRKIAELNPASIGGNVGKWLREKTFGPSAPVDEIGDLRKLLESDPTLKASEREAMQRRLGILVRQRNERWAGEVSAGDTQDAFSRRFQARSIGDLPDQAALKKAAEAAAKELEEQKKLMLELAGLTPSFTEDWDRLTRIYAKGAITLEQLTGEQEKLLAKQPAIKSARETEIRLAKEWNEAVEQGRKEQAEAQLVADREIQRIRLASDARRDTLAEEREALELERSLLGATDAEREVMLGNLRIEQQLKRDLWEVTHNLLLTEAQRVEEADKLRANAEAEKGLLRVRAELNEQVRMWNTIESTAHDAWTNIEQDGVGSLRRIGQTIKSAVWDLLYQMTARRWLISIGASLGLPGAASAAQGLASSGNNLLSLGGLANAMGFGSGSSIFTQFATSSIGQTLGLSTTVDAIGGLGTASSALTGAGSAFATAMPWVAAAAAAFSLISKATKGETRVGADLGYWHGAGARDTFTQSGGNPMGAEAAQLLDATARSIDATMRALGVDATTAHLRGGFASSDKGRGGVYSGGVLVAGGREILFGESGGRGTDSYETTSARSLSAEQAAKNFAADLLQVQVQALQAVADKLPALAREMLAGVDAEALSDQQAQGLVDQIRAMAESVEVFRAAAAQLGVLRDVTADFALEAIRAAGGTEAMQAGMTAFYDLTTTAEERRLHLARQVADTINAAGGNTNAAEVLATSATAFRDWVQQISGDAGLYGAAMQVAPVMQQLTTSMEDAARAAAEAAEEEARLQQERAQARAAALEGYFSNYLTRDEQRLRTAQSIQQRLAAAGGEVSLQTILTATLQDFRKVFQQAWDSGNGQMVDALLDVQEQFHGLASAAETLGDAFERGRSSLDAYVGVFDRQIGGLQTGLTRDRGYLDSLRGFKQELGLGPLAGLTGEQQYLAQRAEFERLMALPTNSEERLKALPGAGRAFLEASSAHLGAGSMQHILNRAMVMGTTEASELSMQSAVEIAQAQLTVLEDQRDALQAIRDLQEAGNAAQLQAAIAYINTAGAAAGLSTTAITAAIAAAQAAQGVLDAGNTGMITAALASNALAVGSAVTTLGGQISAQLAAMTSVAQGDPNSPWSVGNTGTGVPGGTPLAAGWILHPMFGAIDAGSILRGFHQRSDVHGAESWLRTMGLTQADAASLTQTPLDAVRQWFASGGIAAFAAGANLIPQDMLAVVHRHEAIIPAAFNPWAPAGGGMAMGGWRAGGADDGLARELRALREENKAMRGQLEHLTKVLAGYALRDLQQGAELTAAVRERDLTERFAPRRKVVST